MSSPFSIAITTVANEAKAREIATAALEARLAACVQLFPIQSLYIWKEELRDDREVAVHLKIRGDDFAALQSLISHIHDYDTPEILKIDIAEGNAAYLDWLSVCVRR